MILPQILQNASHLAAGAQSTLVDWAEFPEVQDLSAHATKIEMLFFILTSLILEVLIAKEEQWYIRHTDHFAFIITFQF